MATTSCPYCLGEIDEEATVCKHCSRGLTNTETGKRITKQEVQNINERSNHLEAAIAQYLAAGWVIAGKTTHTVQMAERKQFNWPVFLVLCVVGLFTAFIPPLVYWIWFLIQKPNVAVLSVDSEMNVLRNGIKDTGPTISMTQASNFGGMFTGLSKNLGTTEQVSQPAPVPTRPMTPEEKAAAAKSTRKILLILALVIGIPIVLCVGCYGLQIIAVIIQSIIKSFGHSSSFLPALAPTVSRL